MSEMGIFGWGSNIWLVLLPPISIQKLESRCFLDAHSKMTPTLANGPTKN